MHPEVLEHWSVLSPLLDEAIELTDVERRAWLDALPVEHAALRPLLERLLARRPADERFLEDAPLGHTASPQAGAPVGPFRLIHEIGRGGMGAVWLAKRMDGRLAPAVAVKLPFQSVYTPQVRERFERERHILAALNHPNVARFYEAGTTADGQSYLALEYVEGEPLPEWCERRGLDPRSRLELFLQVLRAVQYAHAYLVIHRDLKPSNIAVTAQGMVKLLDFGIAKLLDEETGRTDQTELTRLHGRLMTLDYASPEQVRGEPLTTATDIYSLGVVLYELLTGTRPYRLQRGSVAELEEAILSGELRAPSQAARDSAVATRATQGTRRHRTLRGDLDAITLKALARDPAARYATVAAFAEDCERWLAGLPVLAQPQSRLYRISRFVRRHRLALGATAAVAVALLAGAAIAAWQATVAFEQSRLASEEAAKQRAVQSFLTALFDRNTRQQPDAARARNMTVREVLLEASERLDDSLGESPAVQLELGNTIARLLRDIDEYERAAQLSRDAVTVARANGLTQSDAYVEALIGLATAARLLGHGEEALAARDESLQVLDARGDRTSLLRARANANTVAQFTRDLPREIELVAEAVQLFEQRYPNDPGRFSALYYLANLHRTNRQPVPAEAYFRQAIEAFGASGSRDYTTLGASHAFVGSSELWTGRIGDALRSFEAGLALLDRHAGTDSLVTRFQRAQYAEALHTAGRAAEAHAQFESLAAARARTTTTIADFDAAIYRSWAYVEEGRPREAEALLMEYADNWLEFGRRYVPNGRRWAIQLAFARAMQGRHDEARSALARLGELPKAHYDETLAASPDYAIEASWIELATGDAEAAWTTLNRAGELTGAEPEDFATLYVRAQTRAAEIAARRGDPAAQVVHAERALRHLRQRAGSGTYPFLEARAQAQLGQGLAASGRPGEAREHLEAALGTMSRLHGPGSPWLQQTAEALALASASAR